MENFEINIGGTDVTFMVTTKEGDIPAVTLTETKRVKSRVNIPDIIETPSGKFICTSVGKKAFLSSKSLQFLSLPGSVGMLDDWALSKCINLKQVVVRKNDNQITLGRGVFDGDEKIERIDFGGMNEDSAHLLGLATRMNAGHLFTDLDLGEATWFASWDMELATMMVTPDEAGFDELALCGEEDIILSLPEYVSASRRKKAGLALNRLVYALTLSGDYEKKYREYITGPALYDAWEVLKSDYGENLEFFTLFCNIGAVNSGNIDSFLDDLGEEHAAAKAFLIGYKREHFSGGSIFDELEL